MKILFTGTNAPHIGSDRVPWKYATGVEALVDALRVRHEVEWRAVTPGEDVSPQRYDKVFCVLGPPNALTAQYLYGVLWIINQRADVELVLDDHQTHQVLSGYRTVARDFDRLWRPILNRKCRQEATDVSALLEHAVTMVASHTEWPWRVWAPVFPVPAAKPELLGLPVTRWALFDPSIYWWKRNENLLSFVAREDEERERVWISASLLDKQPWLQKQTFGWPVYGFGNKKRGQPRVRESSIIRLYGQSWGVISCPHRHAGSGWWRNRYQFAAMMGAVTYGALTEVMSYGPAYQITSPTKIEDLKTEKLAWIAETQSECYRARMWSNDQLLEAGDKAVLS